MPESNTIIGLIIKALEKVGLEKIFAQERYESRRKELKGTRLVKLMVMVMVMVMVMKIFISINKEPVYERVGQSDKR
jgi:hypothetical protein